MSVEPVPSAPLSAAEHAAAADRRRRLLGVQLRAVVGDHLGPDAEVPETEDFAPGAAVVVGRQGWLLVDSDPARSTGRCLAWMLRRDLDDLNIVVADRGAAGVVARRAGEFDLPVAVWVLDGRSLTAAVAAPIGETVAEPDDHHRFDELMTAAGAQSAVESGVVTGEVRGLEVCRVVTDADTGAVRLEVGVGAHDREVFAMVHGDVPTIEALRGVVAAVIDQRTSIGGQHPITRVAPERFLRWRLIEQPGLLDVTSIAAAEPPVPRQNLKDPEPAAATMLDDAGRRTPMVCSTGVVLDLVPFAADARLADEARHGPTDGELTIVVPERDQAAITRDLVAALRRPARLVTAPRAATSLELG